MFCSKCGKEIKDEAAFCPYCGAKTEESADEKEAGQSENKTGENAGNEDFAAKIAKLNDTKDTTSEFDKEDIDNNKGMSILAYLSWLDTDICRQKVEIRAVPRKSGVDSGYHRYGVLDYKRRYNGYTGDRFAHCFGDSLRNYGAVRTRIFGTCHSRYSKRRER